MSKAVYYGRWSSLVYDNGPIDLCVALNPSLDQTDIESTVGMSPKCVSLLSRGLVSWQGQVGHRVMPSGVG